MSLDQTQRHPQHSSDIHSRHPDPSAARSIQNDDQHSSVTDSYFDCGYGVDPVSALGEADNSLSQIGDSIGDGRAPNPLHASVVRLTDPEKVYALDTDNNHPDIRSIDAASLAPEILAKVFSFLDPWALCYSAAVCRSWARIARDDATWRAAFATFYNLEAAEGDIADHAVTLGAIPSLRRFAAASWRAEFQQRCELLRRWRKSRAPTVLSTPRVDLINQISVSKHHSFMLSTSQVYGVASRSNPFTGKVTKGYLDAEGTANGAGNGNPNVEFSPNVTALSMGADASSVAWGFRSGEVGLTTLTRQGINPRGAIRSHQFSPRGGHAGPVSAIAVPLASGRDGVHGAGRSPGRLRQQLGLMGNVATTFVSAGHDGTVRLWSSLRPLPIWVASIAPRSVPSAGQEPNVTAATSGAAAAAAPICALDYDARAGIIVAGSTAGKVVAWFNLNVAGLISIRPDAGEPEQPATSDETIDEGLIEARQRAAQLVAGVRSVTIDLSEGSGTETSLDFLRIDADPMANVVHAKRPQSFSILAHHSGARVFLRHRIAVFDAVPAETSTTVLGGTLMSEITAIKPDFEPRLPHDKKPSATPSPMASAVNSPMFAPSRSESTASVARLNIGPSPYPATGAGQYPEKKYVYVGTKAGSVHLFDWETEGAPYDESAQAQWQGHRPPRFRGSRQVSPSLSREAHHNAITSLEITTLHLIIGTSDGTIKVLCALSGDVIRTINDRTATRHPARMLATGELTDNEAARFRVQQIVADHDTLIAAIGHQILAFRAEPLRRARDKKSAAKRTGKSSGRNHDSKFQLQVDMQRDLRESQAQLRAEREERQAQYSQMKSSVADHGLGDMTEEEAFEYAMMLSKDEEEAKARAESEAAATTASSSRYRQSPEVSAVDDPELADALEQIALAESRQQSLAPSRSLSRRSWSLEDGYAPGDFDMDDDGDDHADVSGFYLGASASPSPSPHASPYLAGISSPSRARTMLNRGASSSALDRSHPESKIRTVTIPRPGGAGGGSFSPTATNATATGGVMQSPKDWPAMSPPPSHSYSPGNGFAKSLSSTTTTSLSSYRGASPLHEANDDAPSSSAWGSNLQGKKASLGAWAIGSPKIRPKAKQEQPTNSLLSAGLNGQGSSRAVANQQQQQQRSQADEEMDEDLKSAIELSLAEERSRLEKLRSAS
ncbi:hypothetical protein ACQY0O_001335 [Thecaphora frezii]